MKYADDSRTTEGNLLDLLRVAARFRRSSESESSDFRQFHGLPTDVFHAEMFSQGSLRAIRFNSPRKTRPGPIS